MIQPSSRQEAKTAQWKLVSAFAIVYITWGTTYLAIKEGVEQFPPALFGGVRILAAGLVLLIFLLWRGEKLLLPLRELLGNALVGVFLFVGGNGLITYAEKTVPSGTAAILVATTPMWMALLEMLLPRGGRLAPWGWVGLILGMLGVALLLISQLGDPTKLFAESAALLVLLSSVCWSVGSVLARYQPRTVSPFVGAVYQMVVGGSVMILIGLLLGEQENITAANFTRPAVYSFFHLLVFGSLLGYLAYNWLLNKVSAASAGTYAYVNPVLAVLVGWLLANEIPSIWLGVGLTVILIGVALVRMGSLSQQRAQERTPTAKPREMPAPPPDFEESLQLEAALAKR
jgi:drug/metabolite transporter (DMT)-like permease